jgi:peptide/nickel transport system substrate-binding protein
MRIRTRGSLAVASLAVLAMTVAACGGASKSGGTHGSISANSGTQGINPGTGAPKFGGTLNMLGDGDVDYMDYNASYYSIGYLVQRLWLRTLYTYPAQAGKTFDVVPDLATGMPTVSADGKTQTITLRSGVYWNTTPKTPVTAADVILGVKRSCNPTTTHFGGLADYEGVVVGMAQFCTGFLKVSPTSLAAINNYINHHQISGLSASGQTLTIHLTQPSSYLDGAMTMDSWAPAPPQSLNYLPGSSQSGQHMIADGPYQITQYIPGKLINLSRNPVWNASTDPVRKAYVSAVHITETGNPQTAQEVLQTNSSAGGMELNAFPPVSSLPGLIASMTAGTTKNMNLGATDGSNPYLVFNTISPNNNHALAKQAVRQAISMAIDRAHLTQDLGGPDVAPPLCSILPQGIDGAQPNTYCPFPFDPAKAKAALKAAGYPNGIKLTVLYNAQSTTAPKIYQSMASDMAAAGITLKALPVPPQDLYTKYAYNKSTAQNGVWDIIMVGWGPDWFGSSALSFFNPLYTCPAVVPGGSNYTYWCSPALDKLVAQAIAAPSLAQANSLWAQADKMVTNDAVTYQITQDYQPDYHSSFVHNAVYVSEIQNFDPANVWLSSPSP